MKLQSRHWTGSGSHVRYNPEGTLGPKCITDGCSNHTSGKGLTGLCRSCSARRICLAHMRPALTPEVLREAGLTSARIIRAMPPEKRRDIALRREAAMSPDKRSEMSRKAAANVDPEVKREQGRRLAASRTAEQMHRAGLLGAAGLMAKSTPEERRAWAVKASAASMAVRTPEQQRELSRLGRAAQLRKG